MIDYRQVLAKNVRAARKKRGFSQEALEDATGIDRTYISGIERGLRNPSLTVISYLAKSLGETPASLLTPDGDVPPEKMP